jgi:general secretion pathway protein K
MSVVALAAMAATALMITQSTWARQSELAAAHAQAQSVVQAGADWARAVLSDDRRMSSVDHLGEPWALRLPKMSVEGGELDGYIQDQQGLFNLNNLVRNGKVSNVPLAQFQRLLSTLGLPAELAGALADWIDADGEPQPQGGAEDEAYMASQPPYLAANRPLIDLAELAMVRGFDESVRARLRPFVCALPTFTAVNVNTAPAEVLVAIMDGLDLDGARNLIASRERAYFRDRNDFARQLPKGVLVPGESISFSTDYFMATLRVNISGAQARGVALLARGNPGVWPTVIWRKAL